MVTKKYKVSNWLIVKIKRIAKIIRYIHANLIYQIRLDSHVDRDIGLHSHIIARAGVRDEHIQDVGRIPIVK